MQRESPKNNPSNEEDVHMDTDPGEQSPSNKTESEINRDTEGECNKTHHEDKKRDVMYSHLIRVLALPNNITERGIEKLRVK